MKSARKIMGILLTALIAFMPFFGGIKETGASNMYQNSDFIETEQPELSEESKRLISLYQKNPTEENYLKLRDNVIANYNAVLDRKEAKLAELKTETAGKPGGEEIVAEMEEIVQEMHITYWSRINSSMLRFTDTRLLEWKISDAAQYEYIPVMGAGESIYVKRAPVTNAEYAAFVKETGRAAPSSRTSGSYPDGEDDYPVNFVSYEDALSYCDWLTERDGVNTYRLPNESEWELAAGHMPKDADFNCGVNDGRTPVEQYADVTRGAHGAVDFWGNVWEWTSTVRDTSGGVTELGVKGGSWKSDRTDCRTEYREEGRDASKGYEDVGFRVLQVRNGIEPEQNAELATLASPVVSAVSASAVGGAGLKQITLQIGNPVMNVNGAEKPIDDGGAAPVIVNGRTLLPVRAIVEEMGGTVAWNGDTKTVTLNYGSDEIILVIDSLTATLNGKAQALDTAPIIINGRTMLPIRFIAEGFGFNVDWNEDSNTVVIDKSLEEREQNGAADNIGETVKEPAKLMYQGQGSIRIVTAEGKVIYIDPYAGSGYNLPADLILVTHGHSDHNALDKIKKRNTGCAVITQNEAIQNGERQTFDFGYVKIEAVEAGYNEMHDAAECVGYVLTLSDGKKIYASGDTSTTPQMSEMAQMRIDYAFFCCDGVFNMGLEEAALCAETVGAKHNIPYHMTGKTPKIYDREIAERFSAPNRLIIDAGEEIEIV